MGKDNKQTSGRTIYQSEKVTKSKACKRTQRETIAVCPHLQMTGKGKKKKDKHVHATHHCEVTNCLGCVDALTSVGEIKTWHGQMCTCSLCPNGGHKCSQCDRANKSAVRGKDHRRKTEVMLFTTCVNRVDDMLDSFFKLNANALCTNRPKHHMTIRSTTRYDTLRKERANLQTLSQYEKDKTTLMMHYYDRKRVMARRLSNKKGTYHFDSPVGQTIEFDYGWLAKEILRYDYAHGVRAQPLDLDLDMDFGSTQMPMKSIPDTQQERDAEMSNEEGGGGEGVDPCFADFHSINFSSPEPASFDEFGLNSTFPT